MINLEKHYLDVVKRILSAHVPDCEVRAFGSRVDGRATRFSDLDLALVGKGKLACRVIENLKDAMSASNLPIMIDVIDWHDISTEFRRAVEKKYEVIQTGA